MEAESDIGSTDPVKKNQKDMNPWPYLRNHFGFKGKKGHSFIM